MDRQAWRATMLGDRKESETTEWLSTAQHTHTHTHTYILLVLHFWTTLMNTSTQGWYRFIFSFYEKVSTCSSSPDVGKSRKPARILENAWTLEPDLSLPATWPYTGQQINQKPSLPLPFVITSSLQILAFYHHLIYVQHFLYYPGFTVVPVFED